MKTYTRKCRVRRSIRLSVPSLALLTLVPLSLDAQDEDSRGDDVFELSPFVVDGSEDSGYVTTQSLSGSRFSQNLSDIPANISVMTAEMMQDLGAYDMQEAMDWSVNAIASGVGDSSTSEATGISDVERSNTNIQIRGLNTSNSRNFFKWTINSDGFNTQRIDTSRGPNALLFGVSALAGLSNVSTKQAMFKELNDVSYSYSSEGGAGRLTTDLNRVLLEDKLAVRLNLMTQDIDQWRDGGNTKTEAIALAATWKLPSDWTLRFDGEYGSRDIISPRTAVRDATNNWDHYTITDPGIGAPNNATRNARRAAAGVTVLAAGTSYIDKNNVDAGMVDWAGALVSTGVTTIYPKTFLDEGLSTGITYSGFPIESTATIVDSPDDAFNSVILLPDWDYAHPGMSGRIQGDYSTYSLFLEKKFSDNMFMEIAYNHQEEERLWHTMDGNTQIINLDLQQTLPAGYLIDGSSVNPHFGQAYFTNTPGVRQTTDESDELRALLAYRMKGEWYDLNLGASFSYQETSDSQIRYSFRTLDTVRDGNGNDVPTFDTPVFRTYLSDPIGNSDYYEFGNTYTVAGRPMGFISTSGFPAVETSQLSGMVFLSGAWGEKRKLKTTMGIRRDEGKTEQFSNYVFDDITGEFVRADFSDDYVNKVNSPSYGAVYSVTDWLAVYGNYSKSFNFSSTNLSWLSTVLPPPIGESTEFGIRFKWGKKLSGSINLYDSQQENNIIQDVNLINRASQILVLLGEDELGYRPVDTDILTSTGYEFQMTGNPTKSWTIAANLAFPESARDQTFMFAYDDWWASVEPGWRATAASLTAQGDPNGPILEGLLDAQEARRDTKNVNDGVGSLKLIKMTGSVLTKYTFRDGSLKGLSLGGGAKYRGENNIARDSTSSDVLVDAYWEHTVFARYKFKWQDLDWNVSLNVTNPFDELNFRYTTINANTLDGQSYRLSAPRSAKLGFSVGF